MLWRRPLGEGYSTVVAEDETLCTMYRHSHFVGFFVKKSLPLFHDHHQERSKEDLKPLATKQELKGLVTKQQSKAQPLELKAYTDRQVGNLAAMVKRAFLELKSASIQSLINSTAANGLTNTSASSPRWARL